MKMRWLNGERVYVDDVYQNYVKIYKHRDIIRVLNKVFREMAASTGRYNAKMSTLCISLGCLGVPAKKVDISKKELVFDRYPPLEKEPRLDPQPSRRRGAHDLVDYSQGLRLIQGGKDQHYLSDNP